MGLLLYLVGDVPRIQNEGNSAEMRGGFHLNEKFHAGHDRHLVIRHDEIHVQALRQPSESVGPMFGFFAGIPMVLQKVLQALPSHLMIIDEENAFHDGRVIPRVAPGEFLTMRPFDGFDGRPGACVGKHQVQSLSQYIGVGAYLLRGEVWLFFFQMK
jgi:hypothetical protein